MEFLPYFRFSPNGHGTPSGLSGAPLRNILGALMMRGILIAVGAT